MVGIFEGTGMNIYLLIEDGDSFCIKAKTMAKAINVCEQSYLEDRQEELGKMGPKKYDNEYEKQFYHEQILESCSLVGELKN